MRTRAATIGISNRYPDFAMELSSFNAEYVQRLAASDSRTVDHFTSYFSSLLLIKLRNRLRSPQQIEDVRQETFLRVIQSLKKVEGGLQRPERLGAFVNSVCNNVLLETYRASSRHTQPPEDYPEPVDENASADASVVTRERKQLVQRVLSELALKDREILRRVFLEEWDKDDICREMKITGDYLRVLVHRAKTRFRAVLVKTRAAAV
jgi:RNA polymerase sigma-70 factor (ECF subfamily)